MSRDLLNARDDPMIHHAINFVQALCHLTCQKIAIQPVEYSREVSEHMKLNLTLNLQCVFQHIEIRDWGCVNNSKYMMTLLHVYVNYLNIK